ncbi:hypothetical protein HN018_07135 [Lichenicola cladoniae]|uniref:Uncharacterized protein n=1 Tax=Lichenicola cladoniae TaxID=1484109 RepID=A0A6M8HNA8_9PROT|nr:hypothetical protein [Lichenicola cladoniae]NPD67348.1 hypothetical protein [Acetobacteraceae bacterium]QKE89848.1 hypothetical protein HN018_07135 [Lichenicola cladoniae]
MTSEFPLLSAVLEQSLGPLPPAGDIGRVLGALGITNSSYHSFEPPPTPEPPQANPQNAQPQMVTMRTAADDRVVEPAYAGAIDQQLPPALPTRSGHDEADLPRPEPRSHEPAREAPVWTTPTLGIPTRIEPRVTAHAAPAPLVHAMAEQAASKADWSRHLAEPDRAATRPASRVPPPDTASTAGGQLPVKQPLSLGGLFRILGSPAQTQAAPSRTLRDVFGYAGKRNS